MLHQKVVSSSAPSHRYGCHGDSVHIYPAHAHMGGLTLLGNNGNALKKIKRKTFFLKKVETLNAISERFPFFLKKENTLDFSQFSNSGPTVKHLTYIKPLNSNNTTITKHNYYVVSSKEMYMIIQPVIPQLWPLLISNYSYHQ